MSTGFSGSAPAVAALILALTTGPVAAEPVRLWQEATLVHRLSPTLADRLRIRPVDFEVRPGPSVLLLLAGGDLFDLGSRTTLTGREPLGLTSFALSDGVVVGVRGRTFGFYDQGRFHRRLDLPATGMHLGAGPGQSIYLYGSQEDRGKIYLLDRGGILPLVDLPDAGISALDSIGDRLFFAAGNAVYTLAPGEQAGLLFVVERGERVHSLAADPVAGIVYFGAGDSVYAMRAGVAIEIVRGLKGVLRHAGDSLFVLDTTQPRLVEVKGLVRLTQGHLPPAVGADAFRE